MPVTRVARIREITSETTIARAVSLKRGVGAGGEAGPPGCGVIWVVGATDIGDLCVVAGLRYKGVAPFCPAIGSGLGIMRVRKCWTRSWTSAIRAPSFWNAGDGCCRLAAPIGMTAVPAPWKGQVIG
ncbi:MAG: hypothetical protein NVS2B11_01060 [Acetobacteraceae bacterium]